jgi:hypothetical protein
MVLGCRGLVTTGDWFGSVLDDEPLDNAYIRIERLWSFNDEDGRLAG